MVSGRRRDSIVTRYYLDENGERERREGKKWNADPLKSLDAFIKREVRKGSLDISINRTINVLPTAMPPGKIIKRMNPHVIGKSSLMQLCFFTASFSAILLISRRFFNLIIYLIVHLCVEKLICPRNAFAIFATL